jgi:hypothetical protein
MERRSTARVRFSAFAEIIHADSVESTLVTELSLRGCYLKPTTPLACGTLVTVRFSLAVNFFKPRHGVVLAGHL